MKLKSEIVDTMITVLEDRLEASGRHLIKTDTLYNMCSNRIDLSDESDIREELLEIGMRQIMQSRLYVRGYFSVSSGFFVNASKCTNLGYLQMIIDFKDDVIANKTAVRNRIKELTGLDGQLEFIPDENKALDIMENKTKEEIINDLEDDAI